MNFSSDIRPICIVHCEVAIFLTPILAYPAILPSELQCIYTTVHMNDIKRTNWVHSEVCSLCVLETPGPLILCMTSWKSLILLPCLGLWMHVPHLRCSTFKAVYGLCNLPSDVYSPSTTCFSPCFMSLSLTSTITQSLPINFSRHIPFPFSLQYSSFDHANYTLVGSSRVLHKDLM